MRRFNSLLVCFLLSFGITLACLSHEVYAQAPPPSAQTGEDGAEAAEQSGSGSSGSEYLSDTFDDEMWAILHGNLHIYIHDEYGTLYSIVFSIYWECFEHTYLLPQPSLSEALADIFFWDRLGDLPLPVEWRQEIIEYFADLIEGE